MKKNYLTTTIKIAISLIILVILIYKLDYKILLDNLIIFPILGIGLFMTNYFMTIILNSLALFLILDYKKKRISFKEFLKMNWFSFSLGQFSPARSGEVSIVYFLKKKYNIPIGESSASFIIYKMFTMITLLLFAIFTAYIYFNSLYNWHLILIIFLIIIFGFLFTITNSKIRFLIKKYILRKYASVMAGFYKKFKSVFKKPHLLFLAVLTNVSKLIYNALIIAITLSILGIEAPLLLIVGINSISLIISFIPISFSGIGIKEFTAVFLFYYLGFNAHIIATIYLILTAIYLIINFFTFQYFIYTKPHLYVKQKI